VLAAVAGYLHAYPLVAEAPLRSDVELVKALLAGGADPNAPMTRGTPVRRNSQDFELPKTLLGATPYAFAAKFLEPEIMRALAAAGADTRRPMKDGATPLMAAAGMGIVAPAQDEKRGANLNARNARGQTPLGALVARKAARPNMIELLRKLGAGM
jgi:ankyrin repeat protein